MAKKGTFSLTCPCCKAILEVDAEARVVSDYTPPPEDKEAVSFEDRMSSLRQEKEAAEKKFEESMRAEKGKGDVLKKKFDDLFEKAKQEPVGPMTRDIDLD